MRYALSMNKLYSFRPDMRRTVKHNARYVVLKQSAREVYCASNFVEFSLSGQSGDSQGENFIISYWVPLG